MTDVKTAGLTLGHLSLLDDDRKKYIFKQILDDINGYLVHTMSLHSFSKVRQ